MYHFGFVKVSTFPDTEEREREREFALSGLSVTCLQEREEKNEAGEEMSVYVY